MNNNALLVVLAYIIGFTTAFIAFGINHNQTKIASSVAPVSSDFSAVVTETLQSAGVLFSKNENGLFVLSDDDQRIVSQRVADNATDAPGLHVAVHAEVLSPDEKYLHFCEQTATLPTECNHYVYLIEDHMVAPVRTVTGPVRSDTSTVKADWQSGALVIGSLRSTNPSEPWYVE